MCTGSCCCPSPGASCTGAQLRGGPGLVPGRSCRSAGTPGGDRAARVGGQARELVRGIAPCARSTSRLPRGSPASQGQRPSMSYASRDSSGGCRAERNQARATSPVLVRVQRRPGRRDRGTPRVLAEDAHAPGRDVEIARERDGLPEPPEVLPARRPRGDPRQLGIGRGDVASVVAVERAGLRLGGACSGSLHGTTCLAPSGQPVKPL